MSKYVELESFDSMWAFGIAFTILNPEVFLVIDFHKWQLKIGKLV